MSIIIWLVSGGLIGWLASMVMGTNDRQGLVQNVLVGIAGASSAAGFWAARSEHRRSLMAISA